MFVFRIRFIESDFVVYIYIYLDIYLSTILSTVQSWVFGI